MLTLQVNIVERMKVIKQVVNLLNKAYQPIKGNASFFFFMYLIGIVVSYEELPTNNPDATVYSNLWFRVVFRLVYNLPSPFTYSFESTSMDTCFIVCYCIRNKYHRPFLLGKVSVYIKPLHAPSCR